MYLFATKTHILQFIESKMLQLLAYDIFLKYFDQWSMVQLYALSLNDWLTLIFFSGN